MKLIQFAAGAAVSLSTALAIASNPFSVEFAGVPDFDGDPFTLEIPNSLTQVDGGMIHVAGTVSDTKAFMSEGAIFEFDFPTKSGVKLPLIPPAGDVTSFAAEHISDDGQTVGGFSLSSEFDLDAIKWQNFVDAAQKLLNPVGTDGASVDGMDSTGFVLVGGAFGFGFLPAVTWDEGTGFAPTALDEPFVDGNGGLAFDAAVMGNEIYTVGESFDNFFSTSPTLWNGSSVAENLDTGTGTGTGGSAKSVTDDVSTVVGHVLDQFFNQHPAIWEDGDLDQSDFVLFQPDLPAEYESGSFDRVDAFDINPLRGTPTIVAGGTGQMPGGETNAIIFTPGSGIRSVEDLVVNELGGSIAPFTALTSLSDLRSAPGNALLLAGMGQTPEGERGWVMRIVALGGGGCSPADIAEPFGLLDLADISAFVTDFLAQDPIADIVTDGFFDLADISAFVLAFTEGCP